MKQLAFFPTPYPGENIYSILSRYHQRSGNPAYAETTKQFFSVSHKSHVYYLTGPIHSDYVKELLPLYGAELDQILREDHSAYRLAELFCSQESLSDPADGSYPQYFLRRIVSRHIFRTTSTSHGKSRMKYCPCCAAEQAVNYGEPYWEVLPQIRGVAVCPKHMRPLLKSRLFFKDIQYSLITLSEVIDLVHDDPVEISQKSVDEYYSYAKDIALILTGKHDKHKGNIKLHMQKLYSQYMKQDLHDRHTNHTIKGIVEMLGNIDSIVCMGNVFNMSLPLVLKMTIFRQAEGSIKSYCEKL